MLLKTITIDVEKKGCGFKMHKKIRKKPNNPSGKLLVDRFFEVARKNMNLFAFQNVNALQVECLAKYNVTFLVTKEPKRCFFKDKNTLIDEGFKIYFNNFDNELLSRIKSEAIKQFGKNFFIKIVKYDNRNSSKENFNGEIQCYNLKERGIK